MSASGRFVIFPSSVTHAGGTFNMTYIRQLGLIPGSKIHRVEVSGAVDAGANLLANADPMINVGIPDLSAAIGAINPFTGLKLTAGGVVRFQQADDDTGIFMTGGTHVTETFGLGYAYINELSASQDDEEGAVADVRIFVLASDGLTNPFTSSITTDLSGAPSPAFGTEYYLGPTYLAGVQLPGILQASIAFGLEIKSFRHSGGVFPVSVRIVRRRPILKIKCAKLSADAAASPFLRALSGAFVQYFQKATDAGIRVSTASAVHVKVSASAGAWFREDQGGRGLDDASVTYCCYPTTVPTYSVASTIP